MQISLGGHSEQLTSLRIPLYDLPVPWYVCSTLQFTIFCMSSFSIIIIAGVTFSKIHC